MVLVYHEGVEQNITVSAESRKNSCKVVSDLPSYYTEVLPVTESIKKSSVSAPMVLFLNKAATISRSNKSISGLIMYKKL